MGHPLDALVALGLLALVAEGRVGGVLLDELDAAGPIDLERVSVNSFSVRAVNPGDLTGASPLDRSKQGPKLVLAWVCGSARLARRCDSGASRVQARPGQGGQQRQDRRGHPRDDQREPARMAPGQPGPDAGGQDRAAGDALV